MSSTAAISDTQPLQRSPVAMSIGPKRPAEGAPDDRRPPKRARAVWTLAAVRAWEPEPSAHAPSGEFFERVVLVGLTDELQRALLDQLDAPLRAAARHVDNYGNETPRSELWFATNGASYPYSRRVLRPQPSIPPALGAVFEMVNLWLGGWIDERRAAGADLPLRAYDGVLCNGYYHLFDSVQAHADDERTIDQRYPILSVSLGHSWAFVLRRVDGVDEPLARLVLRSGDVWAMLPGAQSAYTHEIEKRFPSAIGSVQALRELAAAEAGLPTAPRATKASSADERAAYAAFVEATNPLLECPLRINLTFRVYKPTTERP